MWNRCETNVRPKWFQSETRSEIKVKSMWNRSEIEVGVGVIVWFHGISPQKSRKVASRNTPAKSEKHMEIVCVVLHQKIVMWFRIGLILFKFVTWWLPLTLMKMNQIEFFHFWLPWRFDSGRSVFVGYGVFKQIVLFFVGYGVSWVEQKSVCFLFGENLQHSVDFLFGRKSHGASGAAYHAAPTIPKQTMNMT